MISAQPSEEPLGTVLRSPMVGLPHIPEDPAEAQVWSLVDKLVRSNLKAEARHRNLTLKDEICWQLSSTKIVVYVNGIGYSMWYMTEVPMHRVTAAIEAREAREAAGLDQDGW